ncbi:MAG: peptide chain release factor 2 [Lachnospiraceae bacterium]|nr:peptide chain release factor 2 [Lachnospiraceae bacterium]
MLELDELKAQLKTYDEPMQQMRSSLDLDNKEKRAEELERTMAEPGFWENPEKAQKLQKELGALRNGMEAFAKLENLYEETLMLIDMANEDDDESVLPDVRDDIAKFQETFESMRIRTLLSGPYDANDAIVTLHSGAGGTEACDWCSMLYRMYSRWIDKKDLSMEILDYLDGDEAGIKSVTFQVNGENAYGLLKSEMGIHRLVRISPFNAAGKRQTSFVSCDVMPDIEEDVDIEVKDEDIRIDTYRSSGAGGQHINKTSSAIRITHFPTGIVVTCQNERSQFQNKDKAMQMLKARLLMLKMEENREKAAGIRGEVKEIGWGSQIRSYVFQPYTMVKDLRTGWETGNVQAVMDGDLDPFIDAYLKWDSLGRPDRKAMSAD